jgi:hypothetical protein
MIHFIHLIETLTSYSSQHLFSFWVWCPIGIGDADKLWLVVCLGTFLFVSFDIPKLITEFGKTQTATKIFHNCLAFHVQQPSNSSEHNKLITMTRNIEHFSTIIIWHYTGYYKLMESIDYWVQIKWFCVQSYFKLNTVNNWVQYIFLAIQMFLFLTQ